MPIKEEPVRIEFQYEQQNAKDDDRLFFVEYFSETINKEEKKYVRVTPSDSKDSSVFELDFLVEVVDFLRDKGVVKKEVIEGTEAVTTSALPLPKVQSAIGVNMSDVIPLEVESVLDTVSEYAQVGGLVPPVINRMESVTPTVITASDNDESQIIKRPVIKTRVGENEDPMVAIERAKQQRKINPEKSIKRRNDSDEV